MNELHLSETTLTLGLMALSFSISALVVVMLLSGMGEHDASPAYKLGVFIVLVFCLACTFFSWGVVSGSRLPDMGRWLTWLRVAYLILMPVASGVTIAQILRGRVGVSPSVASWMIGGSLGVFCLWLGVLPQWTPRPDSKPHPPVRQPAVPPRDEDESAAQFRLHNYLV